MQCVKAGKAGTLPLGAEMGWPPSVATIRMQLQAFALGCESPWRLSIRSA
jgi:hypothetical protein